MADPTPTANAAVGPSVPTPFDLDTIPTPAPETMDDLASLLGFDSDSDPLASLLGIDGDSDLPPTNALGTVVYDPDSFPPGPLPPLPPAPTNLLDDIVPTPLAAVLNSFAPTSLTTPTSLSDNMTDTEFIKDVDKNTKYDDNVSLMYDLFALVLAVFFPLATFCGVRFEALLAVPGLNVWAISFAFVVAEETGLSLFEIFHQPAMYGRVNTPGGSPRNGRPVGGEGGWDQDDTVAKFVFCIIGIGSACFIIYSMGFFSITLMGMFAGVLLGSGLHDFMGQYISDADDSDVEWSKVIYMGLCPLLFMILVVFTEWRGQAIMWAFTGAYFGVAMIDWMGFRWDYTNEPRLWPSNFITNNTSLNSCENEWCIIMLSVWGFITVLGIWVQFYWGPLPPASVDGEDLREWEPLMWELEQKYNFKGEALEEMAKLQYQIEKKRIFREKLKYESREARKVMKSVARGTFKSSEQRRAEAQEQLKEKRNRWYGSMGKTKQADAGAGDAP